MTKVSNISTTIGLIGLISVFGVMASLDHDKTPLFKPVANAESVKASTKCDVSFLNKGCHTAPQAANYLTKQDKEDQKQIKYNIKHCNNFGLTPICNK